MSTRFYYTYDGPRLPVTTLEHPWAAGPTPDASYGFSLVTNKAASYAAMADATWGIPNFSPTGDGNDGDIYTDDQILYFRSLTGWWFSPPLSAGAISGTVKGQIRALQSSGAVRAMADMRISLMTNDGDTVAWLYTGAPETPHHQFDTETLTNRAFPDGGSYAFDTVTASAGDRLLVQLGVLCFHPWGGVVMLDLTARPGSDLPEDNIATDGRVPWLEFSQDLSFESEDDYPMVGAGADDSAPLQVARVSVWTP